MVANENALTNLPLKRTVMIVYNVTTKVDWSIAEEWLRWMQDVHIPEMIATGCFSKCQLMRLMEVDEEEGPTYAAQYYADNQQAVDEYLQQHAHTLRQRTLNTWGDKFIAFRSLMQVVN